uniref:Uncharacterized protein n=1 Tax=Octopus bimaculoides TaxID=37653 RepID=A0A0L8H979_OCTBM
MITETICRIGRISCPPTTTTTQKYRPPNRSSYSNNAYKQVTCYRNNVEIFLRVYMYYYVRSIMCWTLDREPFVNWTAALKENSYNMLSPLKHNWGNIMTLW